MSDTGRQLDVAIAMEIFGWQWWKWKVAAPSGEWVRGLFPPDYANPYKYSRWTPDDGNLRITAWGTALPAYSESISAAWQIITRLTGGYIFNLEVSGGSTWAGFSPIDKQITYDAFTDGTDERAAAEAITRAALAAVRAKGNNDE